MLKAIEFHAARKRLLLCGAFALTAVVAGCEQKKKAVAKTPPAKVEKPAAEGKPASVVLTREAEARLGIRTVPVEQRQLQQVRVLGGEVMPRPGSSVTLSAPLSGTLLAPGRDSTATGDDGESVPESPPLIPGQTLKRGQVLFQLHPLLPAESRASLLESKAEVEGGLSAAQVRLAAATVAYERARKLLDDKAGSQRAVDEATAELELSKALLEAAETRRALLRGLTDPDPGTESAGTLPIASPVDGVLVRLLAAQGQLVGAGEPLAEIADLHRLWIRVPVYAGDLPGVDTTRDVEIAPLGATSSERSLVARPVTAPPTADPTAASVDLYYEVAGQSVPLQPGLRIAVTVPLRSEEESLVVPWAAVVHDANGGTWVYEQTVPRTFQRSRVQVRFVLRDLASLDSGPAPGALVVTDGAAELFGTELGVGK